MARTNRSTSKRTRSVAAVEKRTQYKNPPIVEATCEFRFAPVEEWNIAYSGLFLEKVKARYSGKPREQRLLQVSGRPAVTAPREGTTFQEITKVQIPTADGKELVAVGPGMLSVHVMKPYSGWERYRKQIDEALNAFLAIAKPDGIRRIGIRYINRIEPSDPEAPPREFFASPPHSLDQLECVLETFALRHEYVYRDEPVKLLVTMARVDIEQGRQGFILDLDVVQEWTSEPLQLKKGMQIVDDLRRRERQAFETMITDKARVLFDA